MQIVPLTAIPNQIVNVQLAGQSCSIHVYQTAFGLFIELYVAGNLIIGGVICEDRNRIVRDAYFGFQGDLSFLDSQGLEDPDYTGLGGRFALAYLTAAEAATLGG